MTYSDKQIQILSTAEKLFSSKGYDGTSVRDIADEAGVNIAMISYYFGSKEKLMEALFEQRTENIKLRVQSLLQETNISSLEKMELLVDEYLNKIMEKQEFFKIMMCEQVINKNPVIINLIKDLKGRNGEEIKKLIAEGQKNREFKEDIDFPLLMTTLIGTATQFIITQDYYQEYYGLGNLSKEEFYIMARKKLNDHIKILFKAVLSYESK